MNIENLIYIIIIVGLVLFIFRISNRKMVDGSMGGRLIGRSHKDGGIDGILRSTGEKILLEGNENVLTKKVNEIKDYYACVGTPGGIASSLNVIGEGVSFDDSGSCRRI